jgi:enoyl-CoA hydratase/carnithine racemase
MPLRPGARVVVLAWAGEQAFSAGGVIRELPARGMFTGLGDRTPRARRLL